MNSSPGNAGEIASSPSTTRRASERSRPLDCLRALAIFLVLGRHFTGLCPPETSRVLNFLSTVWHRGGWMGVDLFFVLSGFLVSGLLFKEQMNSGGIRPGRFLIRRGFKIYPAFWVLIAVTCLGYTLTGHPPPLKPVLGEVFFLQNYLIPTLWGHTWSLAVEEHFYLLLVLFLYCLAIRKVSGAAPANPFTSLPLSCAVLAVVCLSLRWWTMQVVPYGPDSVSIGKHFFPTHLRVDSLFFGVLVSYLYHYYPRPFVAFATRFRWLLCFGGLGLLSLPFIVDQDTTPGLAVWGYTIISIGSAMLLSGALMLHLPANLFFKTIAYIGSHSYSIYLWHIAVGIVANTLYAGYARPHLARFTPSFNSWPLYAVGYLAGTIVFGILMALAVEFPVLKLRERWFPPPRKAVNPL